MEKAFSKNILHLCSSRTAGETEQIVLSLVKGIADQRGTNIIAAPRNSVLLELAGKMGIRACAVTLWGALDLFGIFRLWRLTRNEKIAVLHAHQENLFLPCVMVKLLTGAKIRIVFHRYAERSSTALAARLYRRADRVIAVSKAAAWGAREQDGVPQEKIRVIYPGTDFTRFNPAVPADEVRTKFDLEGKIVIGTAASMERPDGKGQSYLLEAAQIIKERFTQARYLIVGNGPLFAALNALAKKLRVEDKVIFAGDQDEVEKYIAAMHLFCFLPGDSEGFSVALVEAQAMGKPVIGSSVGGIPEAMEDRVTGLLVPAKDSELLAQTIIELLDDKKRRKDMEEAAVRFAQEHFSLEQMVEGVLSVYNDIQPSEE